MRASIPIPLLLAFASKAQSHFVFPHLILNGEISSGWKYVRNVTAAPDRAIVGKETPLDYAWGQTYPILDIKSEAMACGREAFKTARTTNTADIKAGREVGFHVSTQFDGTTYALSNNIFHTGPAQFYLARAPNDDLSSFNGTDGKWFKIATLTAAHDTTPEDFWIPYEKKQLSVTIPSATPAGKYLLRIEQFQPGSPGYAQFYINCAHVNIISDGKGVIPEDAYATFPGSYKSNDPSIDVDWVELTKPGAKLKYVAPGPKVWTGGAIKRTLKFKA